MCIKVSKTPHNIVFSANIHTTDIEGTEHDDLCVMWHFIYEKLCLLWDVSFIILAVITCTLISSIASRYFQVLLFPI
jgi:hypothetical protein